jgi:hypothetical protein
MPAAGPNKLEAKFENFINLPQGVLTNFYRPVTARLAEDPSQENGVKV